MTKEEFLSIAASKYSELEKLKETKNFYEHEKQFDKIWTELGSAVLQASVSEPPKDRRKKKRYAGTGK
jgi:hypothetical protein